MERLREVRKVMGGEPGGEGAFGAKREPRKVFTKNIFGKEENQGLS